MDTATVFTNLACNQRCGFCTFRRPEDAPGFTDTARVRERIERAVDAGADTLVLSGGEPLLLDAIDELVEYAAALIGTVLLETNGMLLAYPDRAQRLAAAGVRRVRVALNAGDAELSDRLTQTPGGFELTRRGIANARAAGLEIEASVAITRQNLDGLANVADGLCDGDEVLLRVVTDAIPEGQSGNVWVATYEESANAIIELALAARERGIAVRFDGRHAIPLCFFSRRRQFPELFAGGAPHDAHGMTRIDACDDCAACAQCPGVPEGYLALHGERGAVPVSAKHQRFVAGLGRDRRRAVEDELINDAHFLQGEGGLERVLRVNFHCNQACEFCFVDRTLPAEGFERLVREIRRAKEEGVALLSLSGGEPTLHPRLEELVRTACDLGLLTQIQTNAIRCADREYTQRLLEAGLGKAFVSLHASSAELSDAVTAAPGTFDKTILGIDALVEAGVAVTLNHVITGDNHAALPVYAAFVAERWGKRIRVNLSLAHASTALVPRDARIIVRLASVRASIDAAVARLREDGIPFQGFDGQCGMPLCALDPSWYDVSSLVPLASPEPPDGFVKTSECDGCALTDRCVGLRETYRTIHGSGELRAIGRLD